MNTGGGLGPSPQRAALWRRVGSSPAHWVLILITVAGLGVDAYVHWHLATGFDTLTGAASPHISQGQLFRVEAALAVLAALFLLVTRRRIAVLLAFLVAAGGLAVVLLYRYVDVGGLGPLPDMYEPIWYAEKNVSAIGEGIAAVAALALLLLPRGAAKTGS